MWKIYHDLIEGIPPEIEVTKVFIGEHWVYVNAKDTYTLYTGVAMNVCGGRIQRDLENPEGKTLKELAQFSQSWNFLDASIGMAAMNAYYNYPSVVEKCGICPEENYNRTGFDVFSHEITGKKVAVIGHFPTVECLREICDLTVLERNPIENDLPDSACEYILPEQDFIFITGATLINKTLPRLLQLGQDSKVIMLGPTVPLSPILFDYGVFCLSGSMITDGKRLNEIIHLGGSTRIFKNGAQMVQMKRK